MKNKENNSQIGKRSRIDADLLSLSHWQLTQEVMKLRRGIRRHCDSTGHALCRSRLILCLIFRNGQHFFVGVFATDDH